MKTITLLCTLIICTILCSCQKDIEKTKSGISVNFINRGEELLDSDSSILMLNIRYADENDQELFSSKADGRQLALPYNKNTWGIEAPYAGPFYEVLATCKIKDSIWFQLTAEELYVKTFLLPKVPSTLSLSDSSKVNFHVGIDDQMTEVEFREFIEIRDENARKKAKMELEARKAKEDSTIRQHLETQNITNMTRTESGLWYVITDEGEGEKPVENDLITIHYNGFLLDGTLFDSSYEKGEPIRFAFGVRDVLRGWDEGFGFLKLGSKATFILPSHLANGSYSDGPIKPYSILKYEVELLKITKRD